MRTDQHEDMDALFASVSFDETADWRRTPETDDDPDDADGEISLYDPNQARDDMGRWADEGGPAGGDEDPITKDMDEEARQSVAHLDRLVPSVKAPEQWDALSFEQRQAVIQAWEPKTTVVKGMYSDEVAMERLAMENRTRRFYEQPEQFPEMRKAVEADMARLGHAPTLTEAEWDLAAREGFFALGNKGIASIEHQTFAKLTIHKAEDAVNAPEAVAQIQQRAKELTFARMMTMSTSVQEREASGLIPNMPPLKDSEWRAAADPTVSAVARDRVRAFAVALTEQRTSDLYAERGLTGKDVTPPKVLSDRIWENWKQDSQSFHGRMLQLAAAEEMGGVHRFSDDDVKAIKSSVKPDEYEAVKAYVRAQWETTQYAMTKMGAGDHIETYRAIVVPKSELKETVQKPVPISEDEYKLSYERSDPSTFRNQADWDLSKKRREWMKQYGNYVQAWPSAVVGEMDALFKESRTGPLKPIRVMERLPSITIKRNGAASTTLEPKVANEWMGTSTPVDNDHERVVLRIKAPRTAALSIPLFGKQVHEEKEVVIAGSRSKWSWDAWVRMAPTYHEQAVK